MRFFIGLILASLFAPLAHADEWHEYIQVNCDPRKAIFHVREIRSLKKITQEDVDTPGKIYGKRDAIDWIRSENGDVITVKTDKLNIPTCILYERIEVRKFEHKGKTHPTGILVEEVSPIEFKVFRASIDQGNVQRRCGAALGARFQVTVNGVEMANYPSQKELCFRTDGATPTRNHSVSYTSPEGLKHCETPHFSSSGLPGQRLKSSATICWNGKAKEYLEYLKYRDANPDDKENPDLETQIKELQQHDAHRSLLIFAQTSRKELSKLQEKNKNLTTNLKTVREKSKTLEKARDELQEQLTTQSNKSLWQRIWNK